MKMTLWIFWILLAVNTEFTVAFSTGAPLSACDGGMVPRHGFEAQVGDSPVELVMDQYTIVSDQYLRVTIRSKSAFKGFLIRAESDTTTHLGTWYIPYLEDTSYLSESSYLHCSGRTQSAVTHSGRTNSMFVIYLQWKPPADFYGWVSFHATVVENYQVFWLDVLSAPLYVMPFGDSAKDNPEYYEVNRTVIVNKRTSYYNADHDATHKYSTMKITKLLPREESTIPSILKKDERGSTVNDLVNTPVDFIYFEETGYHVDTVTHSKPENPHRKENLDFYHGKPLDLESTQKCDPKNEEERLVPTKVTFINQPSTFKTIPSVSSTTEYFKTLPSKPEVNKEVKEIKNNDDIKNKVAKESTEATDITIRITGLTTTPVTKETILSATETSTQVTGKKLTTNILNAVRNSQRSPLPRILEPTFIFTTDSPTRTSKEINIANSSTTKQRILVSHFFKLTEDFDNDNVDEEGENHTKIVKPDRDIDIEVSRLNNSDLDIFLYSIEHNIESTSANIEDLPEVIIIGNITELDRMPRDNDGESEEEFEIMEAPYQRLKAQYGGWESSGSKHDYILYSVIIIVVNMCL